MAAAARLAADEREEAVDRVGALRDRLADGLVPASRGDRDRCVDGDRSRKVAGICHVCFDGIESEALLFLLDERRRLRLGGVVVRERRPGAVPRARRHGRAAAGRPGSLRLSLGPSTTDADVDAALEVVPRGRRAPAAASDR